MKARDAQTKLAPPIGLAADLAGSNADQRRVADLIAAGPRGSVPSPFLAMLDAPSLAEAIQAVGAVIRYGSTLPDPLRELAILTTAVTVDCGYEWNHHAPIALAAGVSPATLEAVRTGEGAENLAEPGASVIALCREVVTNGQASRETLATIVDQLGRTAATEIVAIAGYYPLLANFIKSGGFDEEFAD
jgi:4-carboxymuconolactone decarboxylase